MFVVTASAVQKAQKRLKPLLRTPISSAFMIPTVYLEVVETSANGAGFGAVLFLDDDEFARGERIAAMAEQGAWMPISIDATSRL
ncbi:MAG: hypothetical protein B6I35_15230 [Anaerolineaceae bacterium 4572_32.2]|nr:MAG: hypothetical protein B6I35_15230 [Anaerolineaceae bacterium 4572_32.2]